MIILRLLNPHVSKNVKHEATQWQIASDISFRNLIVDTGPDKNMKTSISFNMTLDPNSVWYARARMFLSTGATVWGNVNIFTPHTQDLLDLTNDLPSKISVPQVYTSSNQKSHDVSAFTIHATGFEVVGDATHVSTSWIIEDINSKVIWSSLYNTICKNSIDIASIILKPNSVFRLKVMFHSSSNDTSPIGCYTIRTSDSRDIEVLTYLDVIDITSPLKLRIAKIEGVTNVTWEIYTIVDGISKIAIKTTTEDFSTVIDTNILESDTLCLLKVSTDKKELGSKFIPFRTSSLSKKVNMELMVPDDNIDMRFETLDEYSDTSSYPPIYYDRDRYRLSKSKLTVTEILALPELDLPYYVYIRNRRQDENIELLQHTIEDNWIGGIIHPIDELRYWKYINNEGKDFIINHYIQCIRLGIPMFEFPTLGQVNIVPMTDDMGGLLLKNLESYDNLKHKDVRYVSLILDYKNNIRPMPTNNNKDLMEVKIEKLNESDAEAPNNPYRYALTLQDGVCGSVDSRRGIFGFYMSPYENGEYKLVIVDIIEGKRKIIPFTISGNRNRSNKEDRFFGLSLTRQTNPAIIEENPYDIQKNYTNELLRIPMVVNQPKLIYYAALNTTISGITCNNRDVVIKRQSRDRFVNNSEIELLNSKDLEVYKSKIKHKLGGIYREDANYGTIVLQTSLTGERVVKLRTDVGDEVDVILNIESQ